jgi:hypothetical protein
VGSQIRSQSRNAAAQSHLNAESFMDSNQLFHITGIISANSSITKLMSHLKEPKRPMAIGFKIVRGEVKSCLSYTPTRRGNIPFVPKIGCLPLTSRRAVIAVNRFIVCLIISSETLSRMCSAKGRTPLNFSHLFDLPRD